MKPHWPIILATAILCVAARDAAAQTSKPVSRATTTKSGIYNAEQASRGKDVYAGFCRSCHTAETHTGATFAATWNGRKLSELWAYITERMPKNEPGSLSTQEYVDVLAYVLKMNQMRSGSRELSADSTAMKSIRIDLVKPTVRKEK